jgi:hypothetical protein
MVRYLSTVHLSRSLASDLTMSRLVSTVLLSSSGDVSGASGESQYIRGLPGVFEVVGHHGNQTHPARDRWIPGFVDHSVEVIVAERRKVFGRRSVHSVVIRQKLGRIAADRRDIVGGLAVSGCGVIERERESLREAASCPHLRASREVRHMVVLDTREMPDQPGRRVRLSVGPKGERGNSSALRRSMDHVRDVVERRPKDLNAVHGTDLATRRAHQTLRVGVLYLDGFGRRCA